VRPRPSGRGLLVIVIALAATVCPACGARSRPPAGRGGDLPTVEAAHQAVEQSLRAWQADPDLERTTTSTRPVMFVEQQQPKGQRLRAFEVLGETPGYEADGYRRFLARLDLSDPEASVVAVYYVFGRSPVWVYRSEDFEMIMHMDMSMMARPPQK